MEPVDAEIGRELEATVAARRELGPDHDDELIAGFLERIERRLGERTGRRESNPSPEVVRQGAITPLVLGSIGLGIPVTAVALSNAPGAGGIAVAIVAWIAIGAANLGAMFRRR
jgi:hypothetical protein